MINIDTIYHLGKEVKEEYRELFNYLEYIEERYILLHKEWQKQHMLELIDDLYEYLNRLAGRDLLFKDG